MEIPGMEDAIQPLAHDLKLRRTILDVVSQARRGRRLKKGANEARKSITRNASEFVVIAADALPIGIVLHLPQISREMNVPYVFVPSKHALGKACGLKTPVIACSVMRDHHLEVAIRAAKERYGNGWKWKTIGFTRSTLDLDSVIRNLRYEIAKMVAELTKDEWIADLPVPVPEPEPEPE